MTQDLCRAEFEKWYSERYTRQVLYFDKDNHDYFDGLASIRWQSWQAAWNAKPATEHNTADTSQNILITDGPVSFCGITIECDPTLPPNAIRVVHNAADNSQNVEWE